MNYKQFRMVLDAMTCPSWPTQVNLVVIGKEFSAGEVLLLDRMGLRNRVVWAGQVSDGELKSWYKSARAFIFPSLEEGFGFPSLEAQGIGTPVVCSDIPVFRETCGDSALYFDPHRAECLAIAVLEIMNEEKVSILKERGYVNVRRFSWDKCAEQTVRVFEEVATKYIADPIGDALLKIK